MTARLSNAAVVLITSLVIASGCGNGQPPIAPAVTELVTGRWRGIMRLTEVRKNESRNYVDSCVRALPRFTVGTVTAVTLDVVGTGETQEQFGGTASGVSAKLTNLLAGSSCDLHGWIHPSVRWSASLFATQCEPAALPILCENGETRDLRLSNPGPRPRVVVQLRVDRSSGTGSISDIWDVFIAGNKAEEDVLYFWSELSVSRE